MKIRNSFVSNSSSTSYTIIHHPEKNNICKCCGRKDLDLIEIIKRAQENDYLESSIQYNDKSQILGEILSNIEQEQKGLEKYAEYDDNDVHPDDRRSGSNYSVRQRKEWMYKSLKQLRNRYDKLESISDDLIGIEIGYHDHLTQEVFEQAQENGSVEIIEDWG